MKKKILLRIFIVSILILIVFLIYSRSTIKKGTTQNEIIDEKLSTYNSNLLQNVQYKSTDARGNIYVINAEKGEIDIKNSDIIFLENVKSTIILKNSNIIKITSDYGKYNSNNFDTIFSKNVIINYLDNKITGEYLDFSIQRNTMIVSRNVIYTNLENILEADVIEMNIKTKDTKIFMYNDNEKVNIKSKD